MTDDLVKRLKGHSEIMERDKGKVVRFIDVATCTEAADRIEAQAAEIERLREALTQIARLRTDLSGDFSLGSHQSDIARNALAGKAEQ